MFSRLQTKENIFRENHGHFRYQRPKISLEKKYEQKKTYALEG